MEQNPPDRRSQHCCHAPPLASFSPAMISRGQGAILNIGSGAGYAAMPNAAVYTASKHFVRAFTESLRAQLAGTGVTYRKPRQGLWNLSSTKLLVLKAVRLQGKAFSESLRKNAPADIVREFERASPVIFPGRNYRWLMKMQPLMPRRLVATHVAQAARKIRCRGNQTRSLRPSPTGHVYAS